MQAVNVLPERWGPVVLRVGVLAAVGAGLAAWVLQQQPPDSPVPPDPPDPPDPPVEGRLPFALKPIATVKSPTAIAAGKLSDGTVALFITEQAGRIVTVRPDAPMPTDPALVLVIPEVVSDGETGLLGLALSPGWPADRRAFLNYTVAQGSTGLSTILARVEIPPSGPADPATLHEILRFEQPYRNHNSGSLAFGPDGLLYMGVGDGGSGGDPQGHAQNLGDWLGSILRIDVLGDVPYRVPEDNPFVHRSGALPEIWAYGVRNPWRCSFDRKTGDFWMGDVGQNNWEEIDFMPNGKGAGANYGWRLREGAVATPMAGVGGDAPKGTIEPVYVYKHGTGATEGLSVTGGYVYRGPVAELQGRYVFADYQNPRIWSFVLKDGKAADFKDHTAALQPGNGRIALVASFAEDNQGNLFIVDHSGPIYQVIEK